MARSEAEDQAAPRGLGNLRSVLRHFARYKWAVVAGVIALLAVDAMQLVIPRIIKRAVDDLTAGGIARSDLATYGLVIAGLAVGIAVLRFFWRFLIIGTSRHIEEDLRNEIFSHLQTLSARYFAVTKTGDLMAHATNDLNAVRMACGIGIVAAVDAVLLAFLYRRPGISSAEDAAAPAGRPSEEAPHAGAVAAADNAVAAPAHGDVQRALFRDLLGEGFNGQALIFVRLDPDQLDTA